MTILNIIQVNTNVISNSEDSEMESFNIRNEFSKAAGIIAGSLLTSIFGVFFGGYGNIKNETKKGNLNILGFI